MIKRLANHKLVGFIKSGVSASDIGFVNVINTGNITITFCSLGWSQTFLKKIVQVCVVVGK